MKIEKNTETKLDFTLQRDPLDALISNTDSLAPWEIGPGLDIIGEYAPIGVTVDSYEGPGIAPHGLSGVHIIKYTTENGDFVEDIVLKGTDISNFGHIAASLGITDIQGRISRPNNISYHSTARTMRTIGLRKITPADQDTPTFMPLIFRHFYADSRADGEFATQGRVDLNILENTPPENLHFLRYFAESAVKEAERLEDERIYQRRRMSLSVRRYLKEKRI